MQCTVQPGVAKLSTDVETPLLSVIIVSYNTRATTLKCLESLFTDLGELSVEVWVVDNASSDGSPDFIRDGFPNVRLVRNSENSGFGAANNQAMKCSTGEYFLLLNSDAFPTAGAIGSMVEFLRKHDDVGAVGPRLLNEDLSLQTSCWRFPTPFRAWMENLGITSMLPKHPVIGDYFHWEHDSERIVDFVIGACLLVRREVYQKIGGFDERFFMYSEESDWQRRIADAGWKVAFTPQAEVVHLGGASGASERLRINRHFFDSLDIYVKKHHGTIGLLSVRLAMTIGCLARGVLWGLLCAAPKMRARALAKARLHFWLLIRQTTNWHVMATE